MRSVSSEMSAEERRTRLLHSIKAGSGDPEATVIVNFSHLAHAIGMDNAEKLIMKLVAMNSLVKDNYSRKQALVSEGLCQVNCDAAIAAIEAAQYKFKKLTIDKKLKEAEARASVLRALDT